MGGQLWRRVSSDSPVVACIATWPLGAHPKPRYAPGADEPSAGVASIVADDVALELRTWCWSATTPADHPSSRSYPSGSVPWSSLVCDAFEHFPDPQTGDPGREIGHLLSRDPGDAGTGRA